MYVNVGFVIKCLYRAREQHFIRIIYYYYYYCYYYYHYLRCHLFRVQVCPGVSE